MPDKALSVTALTKYIKYKFDRDEHLKDVLVEGEVSNFKHNIRGHFYFTLKDDQAQISAIMFKNRSEKVPFTPKDGMHILLRGYISVFEASGNYQIYVDSMEEIGVGNLYQQYLKLKESLDKEGLFDTKYKKTLPLFPQQIAVLTSSTGAAVRDIIHVINRRYPLAKILVYPTTVQGEQAKQHIVKNIELANEHPDNDIIIVGRGGGSIEDLWAFNEEIVARAIFASRIPIISAVGHETDFTIADFVADKRAPTPSVAAEIAVPDKLTLMRELRKHQSSLQDSLKRMMQQKKEQLRQFRTRYVLKDPSRILMSYGKQAERLYETLRLLHPRQQLKVHQEVVTEREKTIERAYQLYVKDKKQHLVSLMKNLEHINPLSIMRKGYALIKQDDQIIKSVHNLELSKALYVQFHDGTVKVKPLSKVKDDSHE